MRYHVKPKPIDRLLLQPAHALLTQAQKIPFNHDHARLACEQIGIPVPDGDHRTIQEVFSKVSRQANTHRDFLAAYINLCRQ